MKVTTNAAHLRIFIWGVFTNFRIIITVLKTWFKNEHLCTLVCVEINLNTQKTSKKSKCVKTKTN